MIKHAKNSHSFRMGKDFLNRSINHEKNGGPGQVPQLVGVFPTHQRVAGSFPVRAHT